MGTQQITGFLRRATPWDLPRAPSLKVHKTLWHSSAFNLACFPLYSVPCIFCERCGADDFVFRERLYKRKEGNPSLPFHYDGDERFQSKFLDRQDIRNGHLV